MIPALKAHSATINPANELLLQTIHQKARIVILEDNPEILEYLITLLVSTGYHTENIQGYDSVEKMLKAIEQGTGFPLNMVDLFSVDHCLSGPILGLDFIKLMLSKNTALEKHRFILVTEKVTEAQAREICPLIYSVHDKANLFDAEITPAGLIPRPKTGHNLYFQDIENALCETFKMRASVGAYANLPFSPTDYTPPILSGTAENSYKETLPAFETFFTILEQYLALNNMHPARLFSMKMRFRNCFDARFLSSGEITIPKNTLSEPPYTGTHLVAGLAIRGMVKELVGIVQTKKNPLNVKKIINFFQAETTQKQDPRYIKNIPEILQKTTAWYIATMSENCISNKHTLKMLPDLRALLERLAAILYLNPERLKNFQSTLAQPLRILVQQFEQNEFRIPSHKFSENTRFAEDLINFIRTIF